MAFFHVQQLSACIFLLLLPPLLMAANRENCVQSGSRPFYLIGHMTNSLADVNRFLAAGANALEIDVQFTEDGLINDLYHGIPCDCFRLCTGQSNADKMFEFLRQVSNPANEAHVKQFNLLMLDLKIRRLSDKAKSTAGILLADKLIDRLFQFDDSPLHLRVILGLELTSDYPFVYAVMDRFQQRNFHNLLNRIGFDVSGNEDISKINYLWSHVFENRLNVWQGDGITNCLSLIRPTSRLKELIARRESNQTNSYLSKVYHWTIDSRRVLRESLLMGVDGVITNDPYVVLRTLVEPPFRYRFHVATFEDDPFCAVREVDLQERRQNGLFQSFMMGNIMNSINSQPPYDLDDNSDDNSVNDFKNEQNLSIASGSSMSNELSANSYSTNSGRPSLNKTSNLVNNGISAPSSFENDNLVRTAYGNDFKRSSLVDFNLLRLLSQLSQRHRLNPLMFSFSRAPNLQINRPSNLETNRQPLLYPNLIPSQNSQLYSPVRWPIRWTTSSPFSFEPGDLHAAMSALHSSIRTLPAPS